MSELSAEASKAFGAWRRHNRRLLALAAVSVVAAAGLWLAAKSPDGRDAFYVAVAMQFLVWGVIDAAFAIAGTRETRRLSRLDLEQRDRALLEKRATLSRLLVISGRMNVGWLSIGMVLATWGYWSWSPSLVGHGVGMLAQAIVLAVLDCSFARAIRRY